MHEVIAMYAGDMWRPLFSQWMVETDDYAGYLHDDAWDWLQSRV